VIELSDLVQLQNLVGPVRANSGSSLVTSASGHVVFLLLRAHQELLVAHMTDVLLKRVHFGPKTEDYIISIVFETRFQRSLLHEAENEIMF